METENYQTESENSGACAGTLENSCDIITSLIQNILLPKCDNCSKSEALQLDVLNLKLQVNSFSNMIQATEQETEMLQMQVNLKTSELTNLFEQGFQLKNQMDLIYREKLELHQKLAKVETNGESSSQQAIDAGQVVSNSTVPPCLSYQIESSPSASSLPTAASSQEKHGLDFQISLIPSHFFCLCGLYFTSKDDCVDHLHQRTIIYGDRITCSVCLKEFMSWTCFDKHLKMEHKDLIQV